MPSPAPLLPRASDRPATSRPTDRLRRRWAFVAAAAAALGGACTEADLEGVGLLEGARESAEDVFEGLSAEDYSERARAGFAGELRWEPDQEPFTVGEGAIRWSRESVVVDPGAQQVGMILHSHGVQLRVYVDRADLLPSVWTPTWGRTGPDGPGGVGIRLDPGARFDVVGAEEGGVWLGLDSTLLGETELWVEDEALDEVYEPDPAGLPAEVEGPPYDHYLPGDVALLDAPGGNIIGWTSPVLEEQPEVRWIPAQPTGEEVRGHVPLRLVDEAEPGSLQLDREVRAWVHRDDLVGDRVVERSWPGRFRCGTRGPAVGPVSHVLPDTPVYDSVEGALVGRTTIHRGVQDAPGEWQPLEVSTSWGRLEVWVDPDDVRPPPSS